MWAGTYPSNKTEGAAHTGQDLPCPCFTISSRAFLQAGLSVLCQSQPAGQKPAVVLPSFLACDLNILPVCFPYPTSRRQQVLMCVVWAEPLHCDCAGAGGAHVQSTTTAERNVDCCVCVTVSLSQPWSWGLVMFFSCLMPVRIGAGSHACLWATAPQRQMLWRRRIQLHLGGC